MKIDPKLPQLPLFVPAKRVRVMLGGMAHATLNGLVADGILPKPIRLRENVVLFEYAAIMQAVERLRAEA
jgi:hypothetical protein